MADDTLSGITGAQGTNSSTGSSETSAKKKVAGKDEFLNLLVHQLQNQDPLDPMKNEEFAVQLATFSQLEQLIDINNKLEGGIGGGANSVGTMAAFLGQQVTLKDAPIDVEGGSAPGLSVNVPSGTVSARVDLLNAEGSVVGSKTVSNLQTGEQVIALNGLTVPDGSYGYRVVSVNSSGGFTELSAEVSGIVEGFVLEPEAALLVNGQQVPLESVVEVKKPKAPAAA